LKLVSVFGKTSGPFARTGEEIGMISEQIDRIGIRIGRV
jgi:hypothetical protein